MQLDRSHKVHIDKSHKAVTTVVVAATTAAMIFYSEHASAMGGDENQPYVSVMIQTVPQTAGYSFL